MHIRLKYGIFVNKPPSVVFDYLSDPDNMLHWQSSMFEIKAKTKANTHGKLQHGTKVHDVRKVLGKKIDGEWEVIDHVKDKKIVLRVSQGPAPWETTYLLEPHEGGTHLAVEGGGDLGQVPVTASAAHRTCQKMFEQDLTTLADILEH
ncbi:MAG: hypothetical protein E6J91_16905 [Deltaproteobacteria bacterium]|nr:MAG: hypothetical protein E6J91_16905 [Deltaproteobacteria bacterium]